MKRDCENCQNFNPRSPCGERHRAAALSVGRRWSISIHAPLAGSDTFAAQQIVHGDLFQSTLPLRGATRGSRVIQAPRVFQSTLPLRGATCTLQRLTGTPPISIHAPLAGSDGDPIVTNIYTTIISIHAPLAGSDANGKVKSAKVVKFQSTLPLRGATLGNAICQLGYQFQSTLPLRGATRSASYHLLHYTTFQSTLPLRGATAPVSRPKAGVD